MIISCSKINKSFGEDVILSDISFQINEHEKCAVVGINGAGKTTLLNILVGEEPCDSGIVVTGKDVTIGYLKQQQDILSSQTIYDEISSVKSDIFELESHIRDLENNMKHLEGDALNRTLSEYNRACSTYEREGGYECKSRITGIIKGLGFSEDDFNRTINTLSGGQKTRVALGKILLSEPDLIILDEPTNHLDMNSIAWLENYLSAYDGAVLVVSHDRYFMDKIVTKILELDNTKGTTFRGNYTDYSAKKAMLRENMLKAYYNQQREIKHQEQVIEKLKSFNREKSIKRAESREKLLNKIVRVDKPETVNDSMRISFSTDVESGNDVLRIENLSKSFGSNSLFEDVSFELKKGERIAIIGDNGTGKTTLLKIINGKLDADSGKIWFGSNVHIGYYDQEQQLLSDDKTVFEEIHDMYPDMTETQVRNVLASYLFTEDDVFKLIKDLSGGERGRVALAKLMLSESNFLILDEPTNHLDIVSKEILEKALNEYSGTLLYVSHDRYFVNKTATGILHLNNHRFDHYIGNYDYFVEKMQTRKDIAEKNKAYLEASNKKSDGSSNTKAEWEKQKELKAEKRKLENRLNAIETNIHELEDITSDCDSALNDPENAYNSSLLMELTEKKESAISKLDELIIEWEDISEKLAELQYV